MALLLLHLGLAAVDAVEDLIHKTRGTAITHTDAAGNALVQIARADRNVVVFVVRHGFLYWLIMSTARDLEDVPLLPLSARALT
jgi:hypothetical protein